VKGEESLSQGHKTREQTTERSFEESNKKKTRGKGKGKMVWEEWRMSALEIKCTNLIK